MIMNKYEDDNSVSEEEEERVEFLFGRNTKTTTPVRKNGCCWFLLADILNFLDVSERRRRGAGKPFLGKKKVVLLISHDSGRKRDYYIHAGFIREYVDLMQSKLAIDKKHVEAMEIWLEGGFCNCDVPMTTKRKRKKEEEEWESEEESAEEEESVTNVNGFSRKSIFNSKKGRHDSSKRRMLMKASSCIIVAGAEVLRMLPPEDTKQKASILAEMLNQYEILKALHPSRTCAVPSYPPTGSQIRVSDRMREYGLDPKDIEQDVYKQIGELAAQKYRAYYGMSPWSVPVWVGQERKTTYFYTENTCRFIDEAIEETMGL